MKTINLLKFCFYLSLTFIFTTCQQGQRSDKEGTTDVVEETPTEEIIEDGFVSLDFETAQYTAIIKELKGIEKFYVQDDLYRLHSLLKFKKDERYQALENDLKKKDEYPTFINIALIDSKNGYIEFHTAQSECEQTMVYWNMANGDKIIGRTQKCCTMFCESDIHFLLYKLDSQSYISKETSEIISEIDVLRLQKPDNYLEGDGFDYEFILPRKGKNIRYCVEQKCIDLIWHDGTFSILE